MPLFDFKCSNCQKIFETLATYQDKPSCPHCGSGAVERQISKPAPPQFKGSGFYETDYKKKTYQKGK